MRPQSMVTKQVSPFFVFFIVAVQTIGVAIMSFQRMLVSAAGHDGWMVIIFSALMVHVVIWIMYKMLNHHHTIVAIQTQVFGTKLGTVLNVYWIFYFSLYVLVNLVPFVEVIHTWLFPDVSFGLYFIVILFLAYLLTVAGFRTVVGISVLGSLLIPPFLLFIQWPYGQIQWGSLFPIGSHSILDLWSVIPDMTYPFLGFEVLLMAYPFIKEARRSHKWAQLGVSVSVFMYLFCFILPVLYFDEQHLVTILWPLITIWRMEYVGIPIWLFTLLPNMSLGLWAASRVTKQTVHISQRQALRGITLFIFGSAFFFTTHFDIESLTSFTTSLAFYTLFVYLPILGLVHIILVKRRHRP
ncbi:hypothetical protein EPH95_02625 [Salicibibacter halophilus]|uniref:Uncharacterized protein n=1 Tax=Salicibibacter halophilus TaxID=2502791 RepID=A0A514LG17_9BACI|nr:GerAB/ArcD/ProY family transporter [Salicibibacter halophilus]QDI90201.1 hypothetical protein EPH95_02625 [Salicibibacter halophilus]